MTAPPALGSRVSLRYRSGAAEHTDVIGHLEAVVPSWRIRTKSDGIIDVDPADIVSAREISYKQVRTSEIRALEQAAALAWIGFAFGPDTTLLQMIAPLALMGLGVGIALPACNTAGMSAVDARRAGMGSGLMQMTFNIPAALGVGLTTSVIGRVR